MQQRVYGLLIGLLVFTGTAFGGDSASDTFDVTLDLVSVPLTDLGWNWATINSTIATSSLTICVNSSQVLDACTLHMDGTDYVETINGNNMCFVLSLANGNYTPINATCLALFGGTNTTSNAWLNVNVVSGGGGGGGVPPPLIEINETNQTPSGFAIMGSVGGPNLPLPVLVLLVGLTLIFFLYDRDRDDKEDKRKTKERHDEKKAQKEKKEEHKRLISTYKSKKYNSK